MRPDYLIHHSNKNTWLLVWSIVTLFSVSLAFSVTVDEQVGASTDDCYGIMSNSTWDASSERFNAGTYDATYYDYFSAMRFQTVAVPQGATITTAYVTLRCSQQFNGTQCYTKLSGEDTDDAATFSDRADYDSRTRTSAQVDWDISTVWTADSDYQSAEIKTIIQEIIDRGSWASGNDMVIFWENDASPTSANNLRRAYSYDGNASYAPKLHIEYTVPTPKYWDGGGGDNNWSTAANWSDNSVPASSDNVIFNNTSTKNCIMDVSDIVSSITLTADYSGNFDFGTSTLSLQKNGDFSLSGSITAGTGALEFIGTSAQTFSPKTGQTFPEIIQNGSGGTAISTNALTAGALTITSGNFDLGDEDLTHSVTSISTGGGSLDFGTSTLQASGDVTLNSLSSISVGTGTLQFTGSSVQTFTPIDATTTHPNISHTGSGTLKLASYKLECTSFTQSAGMFDFNGQNLETTGSFTVNNGTSSGFSGLGGRTITVGGSAEFNGQSTNNLNMNPGSGWSIAVTGNLAALFASINNSTVSTAPPNGEATQCIDGGSNSGWTFTSENYDDWLYNKQMYINTTSSGADVSGNVTDFPLLVRLNSSNFNFSQAESNGEDIRFANSEGVHLSYEIENWHNPGEEAAIWVKIGTVYGNNNSQYFLMYWGNNSVSSRSDGTKVFKTANNFAGVWHFAENDPFSDATTNSNDGTNNNTTNDDDGLAGTCRNFASASSQDISVAYNVSLDLSSYTVSAWTNQSTTGSARGIVGTRFSGNTFDLKWATDKIHADIGDGSSWLNSTADYSTTPATSVWNYVVYTVTDDAYKIYFDSACVVNNGSFSGTPQFMKSGQTMHIGNSYWTEYFNGKIDEVRIDQTVRSADWIKLCYETQKINSDVVTTPKIWDGGGSDNKWSTADNWSENTAPVSTDEVLFNNTSTKACSLDVSTTIDQFTLSSGYTGTFFFTTDTIHATGNVDFSTGGTITAGTGALEFTGTSEQTFTPKAGQTFPEIIQNGSGGTVLSTNALTANTITVTSGTLDLGDAGLTHSAASLSTGTATLDFGTSTLQITSGNADFSNLSTLTAGTGTLAFTHASNVQVITPKSGATHPTISHTGGGTLQLAGSALIAASFSQSAGILNFNSQNIQTTGNFTITTGNSSSISGLAGRTVTVGGNASLSGQSGSLLDLNTASTWHFWTVIGDLTANYADINYSNASGGSQGDASVTCNNGGTNNNWVFDTEDYENDWTYSKRVYINTTATGADVSGNVSSFPLLMRLTSSNFTFSEADADGDDIRFAKPDGTPISYEIEEWDNSGEVASVWIFIDIVNGDNKMQYFKMYWGNGSASSKSDGTKVFKTANNFAGVWHFAENDPFSDATTNSNDGTNNNTTNDDNGLAGTCRNFASASSQDISVAYNVSLDLSSYTVSAWTNQSTTGSARGIVGTRFSGNTFDLKWATDKIHADIGDGSSWLNQNADYSTTPATSVWNYVVYTVTDDAYKIYFDSACVVNNGSFSGTPQFMKSGQTMHIGNSYWNEYFNGKIDEVRIDQTVRSADWIKLCYETQKPSSGVVYFSEAPVVTGLSNAALVGASQTTMDTVALDYEVEDPDGGTVTISTEYKPISGSWTAMTDTAGDIGAGISATDGDADRRVAWGMREQLGNNIETYYCIRVIADDGSNQDTTASDSFFIDTRPPQNLANFTASDTTGNSVTFTWTIASDANFNHYEIWYGTNQSDVSDSTGTASEWDNNDDANLSTASTSTTAITSLSVNTTYYFKMWAMDDIGNADTLTTMSVPTKDMVAPQWSRTSLGTVMGGSLREDVMYVGTGPSGYSLLAINVSNGTTKWSYSTSPDTCKMPTYYYLPSVAKYQVLAAAGDNVIGRQDDGTSSSSIFSPIDLGSPAGNPYASPEDSTFYVVYTNTVTKRDIKDGTVASGWPQTLNGVSKDADLVVFNDDIFVATTGGLVYQYDADGTQGPSYDAGASVTLPLWTDSVELFVTPNSSKVHKVDVSTMTNTWEVDIGENNSGPAFIKGNILYVAAEDTAYKITDNGGTGSITWKYDAGGTIESGPIISGGTVYFGSNNGSYYALDDTDGSLVSKWPYTDISGDAKAGPWIHTDNSLVIFGTTGGNLDAFTLQRNRVQKVKKLGFEIKKSDNDFSQKTRKKRFKK